MRARFARSFCLAVASIGSFSAAAAAADVPLTLDQALNLALVNNERALKTQDRVEAAEGGLDRARTAFYPTVVAQGAGAWNSVADKNGRTLSANGTVTVSQPLLAPSAIPLYAQAKHALASEQWGAVEDLRLLAFDTTNAFVSALSAEQLEVAAEQRRERARLELEDAQARATAGLASSNDVTRGAVALATAESQVASAKGTVERAHLALAYLIGQALPGALVAPQVVTSEAKSTAWDVARVISDAQERRPDVRSAAEHTASLQDFAREPLYRLAPTVGLSGQIRQVVDVVAPDPGTTENAQLTLTWTIYDAGARYADRRTRLAQADSAALDERALRRSVATDVATAIAGLRAARDVYRIADGAVAQAQKSSDETSVLYKQGLAKAIEVTDANASLYDAEVTRTTAELAMQQAYLNLRYALGLGPIDRALPTPSTVRRSP